jgi:hypothetical protein
MHLFETLHTRDTGRPQPRRGPGEGEPEYHDFTLRLITVDIRSL